MSDTFEPADLTAEHLGQDLEVHDTSPGVTGAVRGELVEVRHRAIDGSAMVATTVILLALGHTFAVELSPGAQITTSNTPDDDRV